jgi:hypothetical protein
MAPSKVESIRGLVEVEDDSPHANIHRMLRRRDLRPQRLERLNVNLGGGRNGSTVSRSTSIGARARTANVAR